MLPPLRGHDDVVFSVAFSPDGSKIISGSKDNTIRVWDPTTGIEVLPPLRGHDDLINSVAFSPDGSKIISGSDDHTIRVWDATTGFALLPPLQGHDDFVYSVAFSPDGSKIISVSDDMAVRVWDAVTGKVLPHLPIAPDDPPSPATNELVTAREWLTNVDTGKYMGALPVGADFHWGHVYGFTYVGWTAAYQLVLVYFPEQ